MSFSIKNNSANSVISAISTLSSSYGSLSVTGGTFPLLSGDTITGTNTEINNQKGSPDGSILLFILEGNAQIEVYINSVLFSALSYSSGNAEIKIPILQSFDSLEIFVDESDLPSPSPTPSVTPTKTITPTVTATNTPTPSVTPTNTPTPSA